MKIDISFGAMADSLSAQLQQFDFNAEEKDILDHYQKDMESISRIFIRDLINYKVAESAYQKLGKKVVKLVEKHLKSTHQNNPQ